MSYVISLFAILVSVLFFLDIKNSSTRIVKLIYIEILYNLIIKYVIGNTGLPSLFNYVTDLILLWIVIEHLYQKKSKLGNSNLVIMFWIMFGFSILSYVLNLYSPLLFIWGFRNNFRFIIFGIICAYYLDKSDVETIMRILFTFFVINILVVTYQAFFISYSQTAIGDYLSGLYSNGTERGGNASLNWLMCITFTYSLVSYLNKTGKVNVLLITLFGSLYLAAICEIKVFFVQAMVISVLALILCKKTYKSYVYFFISIFGLIYGMKLLYFFFPKFENFFELENILNYVANEKGYAHNDYGVGINRMTVFSYVFTNYLQSNISKLFGIGLGNADYSGFNFLISDFYKRNSWSGYTFFYSSFLLIERGVIGLVLYIYNIWIYIKNSLKMKVTNLHEKTICITSAIIGVMCIVSIFTNQTMKLENSAYMVFCVIALPYSCSRKSNYEVGFVKKERHFRVRV